MTVTFHNRGTATHPRHPAGVPRPPLGYLYLRSVTAIVRFNRGRVVSAPAVLVVWLLHLSFNDKIPQGGLMSQIITPLRCYRERILFAFPEKKNNYRHS